MECLTTNQAVGRSNRSRRANLKEADANRIGFFFCAFRDESHWPSAQLMLFDVLRLFTDWFFAHMHQLGKSLNSVSGKLLQISIVLLVVNYFSELVSVLDGNFFMALFYTWKCTEMHMALYINSYPN